MPRHRKGRLPKIIALRQVDKPARRARSSAALAPAEPDVAEASPAAHEAADTLRLPRVISAVRHHGKIRRGRVHSALWRGGTHTVLVSPWFALGTGLVIAAALWIHAPHLELKSPNGAIGKVQCGQPGCPSAAPGTLTTIAPGQKIAPAGGGQAAAAGSIRRRARRLKFEFMVAPQQDGKFRATIIVWGRHAFGSWRLAFTMPGTQITNVVNAAWRPNSSGDGGTASTYPWQSGDQSNQGGQPGDTGDQPSYMGDQQHGDRHYIMFFVIGSGTPTTPTACAFDGAACKFRLVSDPAQNHG